MSDIGGRGWLFLRGGLLGAGLGLALAAPPAWVIASLRPPGTPPVNLKHMAGTLLAIAGLFGGCMGLCVTRLRTTTPDGRGIALWIAAKCALGFAAFATIGVAGAVVQGGLSGLNFFHAAYTPAMALLGGFIGLCVGGIRAGDGEGFPGRRAGAGTPGGGGDDRGVRDHPPPWGIKPPGGVAEGRGG